METIDTSVWCVTPWFVWESNHLRFYLVVQLGQEWKARKLRERLGYGTARSGSLRIPPTKAVEFAQQAGVPEPIVGALAELCDQLGTHRGRQLTEWELDARKSALERLMGVWRKAMQAPKPC